MPNFTMIEIKDLHKSYTMGKSTLHVLKGINFSVAEGEMVAIMGSSGSGKSTLLNILGMLDVANEGTYNLDGKIIKDLDETKAAVYRNKFLGFVFQSFNLISYKTALENVMLPLYYQKIARKERQKSAQKYLEQVGLGDRITVIGMGTFFRCLVLVQVDMPSSVETISESAFELEGGQHARLDCRDWSESILVVRIT